MLHEKNYLKVQNFAKEVSELLGIKLNLSFDEELTQDPTSFGKDEQSASIYYEVADEQHGTTFEQDPALILELSVDGNFQFHHDATPYPTELNTDEEGREMMMFLNPCPTPIANLTAAIYQNFMNRFAEDTFKSQY